MAREKDKMDAVMALMHPAYRLQYYRQTYGDDAYQVMLPVPSTLEEDDTLLPPLPVHGQAGAPKKLGRKKFKRIGGRRDTYASSSFNTRGSELGPAASGTTAAPSLPQGGCHGGSLSVTGGAYGRIGHDRGDVDQLYTLSAGRRMTTCAAVFFRAMHSAMFLFGPYTPQ